MPANWFQKGFQRIASSRPGAWLFSRWGHHVDLVSLRLSRGRLSAGALLTGLPVVALTATGARSGRLRSVPLLGIPDGENLILIASWWGSDHHPAWYYNLKAHPAVTVSMNGRGRAYLARELTGEERQRCWRQAAEVYPGYETYRRRAGGRRIPVVLLEPA